jgi:hypothetical protein
MSTRETRRGAQGNKNEESAESAPLVPVNLDRSHFRSARWWLLAERPDRHRPQPARR